ncbi:MAG TPA: VOC family protein [Pseudonocardia sp.]|uniref:VOC family protein n=1 Tax=Pseudonocardia sp. TaxID=60912 RepID=UPI002BB06A79|nr:VOC family protein [Pseudonocardia sp.]HTF53271.1 VOC family protein [Pseudonocardia sp.]
MDVIAQGGGSPRIGLSEVVLRTPRYERLCAFYAEVLRQPPSLDMTPESGRGTSDPDVPTRIAFFNLPSNYPYTQRVAIFECADVGGRDRRAVGLHHLQIRYSDLAALFDAFEHLKTLGHQPIESANHGIATSLYYLDPDGNRVELSGMNFPTEEEMKAYMGSDAFRRNPDGKRIDPEEFQRRRRDGVSFADLVRLA